MMDARISAEHYESIMSNVDPLLKEGYEITIRRERNTDNDFVYRVTIFKDGKSVAAGSGYPLSEAMADAWMMTPEVNK